MSWRAPIPTLIPDPVVIRLHAWGVDEKDLREAMDDVYAAINPLWEIGPRCPRLQPFFESRGLLEHGAGTALLARILRPDFSTTSEVDQTQLLELSFLHDLGLCILPPDERDLPPDSLSDASRAQFLIRGLTGRDLASTLQDHWPGLGEKIYRTSHWKTLDADRDGEAVLCGFSSIIEHLLRSSFDRSDDSLILGLAHETPPRHFVRIQRALTAALPALSLQTATI